MSANGVFTSTIDYSFFGGGYSTIEGGANSTFDLTIASNVFVPINASLTQSIDFSFQAGVETPTVYGDFAGTIDFTLDEARIVFGRQGYGTSANNEINFSATGSGYVTVEAIAQPIIGFTISATMAQFSLGQATAAFDFAARGIGQNYTLLNKSRGGKNGAQLTRFSSNNVRIKQQPNGVKIRNPGTNNAVVR